MNQIETNNQKLLQLRRKLVMGISREFESLKDEFSDRVRDIQKLQREILESDKKSYKDKKSQFSSMISVMNS